MPVSVEPVSLLDAEQIRRGLVRIAHEIVEANGGAHNLALVGIRTAGVPLAARIAAAIAAIEGTEPPVGIVDVTLYRDDLGRKGATVRIEPTEINFDLEERCIVLVDDVLFTGRTIRSALNALMDFGRPAQVQLAVLVDRGHRELPIRADYVGKNLPTSRGQTVRVALTELGEADAVYVEGQADA